MTDAYSLELERFREAQAGCVYECALAEIQAGRKTSHWIWFVFPQIDGLGFSETTRFYAIKDPGEARAYLADATLGARLRQISQALLDLEEADPEAVMGHPDNLKLASSMTLFDYVAPNDIFAKVLEKFFGARRDNRTLEIIGRLES